MYFVFLRREGKENIHSTLFSANRDHLLVKVDYIVPKGTIWLTGGSIVHKVGVAAARTAKEVCHRT